MISGSAPRPPFDVRSVANTAAESGSRRIAAGDVERAKASMSEAMLDSLGGFGGGAEVRGAVERYLDAGATSPGVSPVPTADFDATLAAGAELI